MSIQRITIQNVKGISSKCFDLNILPNRPSLLVAPNGFGKSSLAVAFKSMNSNRLLLHEDHFHCGDSRINPRLEICYEDADGISHSLEANSTSNNIVDHFDIFVINGQMKAKGVGKKFGGRTNVSASLTIEPVILIDTVPERVEFDYSYSRQKTIFGSNGKVLPNITTFFDNRAFIEALSGDFGIFESALGSRAYRKLSDIVQEINAQSGTTNKLKAWIASNQLPKFEAIQQLTPLVELIVNSTLGVTRLNAYLVALQIIKQYNTDKTKFKQACKYSNYKREMMEYQDLISAFNSSSYEILPREKNGRLIVEFPKANLVSNGERDVLSFISQLHRAKRKLRKNNCILLIDEVFDYLDDANLVAVQYYTTQLIDEYKDANKRIYPMILTHLNPYYFKNFAFSKQKEYFLAKTSICPNQNMVKLLRKREDPSIAEEVSQHLLHFSVSTINKRIEFKTLGIKEKWGEAKNFDEYTNEELKKYIEENPSYDPLAVCCAVRTHIERLAYEALAMPAHQTEFLSTNATRKKLTYAESVGVVVPEYHFLLGVIYNDGMHWRENADNISPIVAKLENLTIRNMIRKVHQ
ncbi:MAG: hypothetical protein WD595_03680 [Waddliaceae bacterium]